jgi:hypothetical protein
LFPGAILGRKEATPMGDLHVDERNSPPVVSPEEMGGPFHGELMAGMPDWKRRLGEDPSRLAELEHDVRNAFSRGADLVVAGLVALVMKQAGFDEACEQTRQDYRVPLSRGRMRPLRIRLLGGLVVWVEKQSRAVMDGTFLGPDAMAELVAMHLHRLGAARAASITFAADGASWIWDRLPTIVRLANLDKVPIHEVLDCCHAAHHISLALAALGQNERERMPLYREHRTLLRNGQWRRVVEELTGLAEIDPDNEDIRTEIAYLRKHGDAGRLQYSTFRKLGLPLGSGAIESSIRRVVNLRLKNNGMFWREEHAEEMLQVRAAGHFQTLGRAGAGDATTPSLRGPNRLEMGTPPDEFQDLNADRQWSCMPRKHGELATQDGLAPVSSAVNVLIADLKTAQL